MEQDPDEAAELVLAFHTASDSTKHTPSASHSTQSTIHNVTQHTIADFHKSSVCDGGEC
jgi:hypothetical protein